MKSTGVLVFYVSETEDADLWRALIQIPLEERDIFFKRALRQTLKMKAGQEPTDLTDAEQQMLSQINRDAVTSWSAENTAHPAHPLQHLYEEVFGPDAEPDRVRSLKPQDYGVGEEDLGLARLFTEGRAPEQQPLKGLTFLLKNVIGEEDDASVLEAIRNIQRAESS